MLPGQIMLHVVINYSETLKCRKWTVNWFIFCLSQNVGYADVFQGCGAHTLEAQGDVFIG